MPETVLLVGGGGREHAIARALADDCRLCACASNRNPGIAGLATDFRTLSETDTEGIVSFARDVEADCAVIGPESALEAGVVDALEAAGVYAFGPQQSDARIETDKAFQRQFMKEHGIAGCPTFETFDDMDAACAYIDAAEQDLAVKPAGLTGGKGVKVIGDQVTPQEAKTYLRESSYERVVLEERLVGEEFTIQAFVANGDVRVTPAVQDHKRAYEGDEGPNTGGMGSYSDTTDELPFMTSADYEEAVSIIEDTVAALSTYTGVLYGQFMLTATGPKVIEFNARFGDPEAMNTLPVLETPFIDVLTAAHDGDPLPTLVSTGQATVCKYAVPAGYPANPDAGSKIEIDESAVGDARLYYASVDEREDGLYTTTSRSFAVVGLGETFGAAEKKAADALTTVGDGLRRRTDIGKPSVVQRRIDHIKELRT